MPLQRKRLEPLEPHGRASFSMATPILSRSSPSPGRQAGSSSSRFWIIGTRSTSQTDVATVFLGVRLIPPIHRWMCSSSLFQQKVSSHRPFECWICCRYWICSPMVGSVLLVNLSFTRRFSSIQEALLCCCQEHTLEHIMTIGYFGLPPCGCPPSMARQEWMTFSSASTNHNTS